MFFNFDFSECGYEYCTIVLYCLKFAVAQILDALLVS